MNETRINQSQPQTLHGQVILKDAKKCEGYYSWTKCLLSTALRRLFPKAVQIEVYPRCFQIDGEFYNISRELNQHIRDTYQLIKQDRLGSFQPFEFTAEILN